MANRLKWAKYHAPIKARHGQLGYVRLSVDVPPELKDKLVVAARLQGVSLKQVVIDALETGLAA